MKTLENQTLLYDENCPLCSIYTSGFIKAGMLDNNGKKPFSTLSDRDMQIIDFQRASNEIALVDNKNKTVVYGIDSLLKVIGNSFPVIEKIACIQSINYLLRKLYSFISYNRKVIIPNKKTTTAINCIPDFNYKYRVLYIVFAIAITSLVLHPYSGLILIFPKGNFSRELLLAAMQTVFQGLFLLSSDKKTLLNYTGSLMTVSLIGSILLIPILILNLLTVVPQIIIIGWFGFAVLIMFTEHLRRIKILELPSYLCFTWILYRIIALVVLFILYHT